MATIKSYTDIEQSKKLAEILPLESADMEYLVIKENGELVGSVPFVKDDSEVEDSAHSHTYDRIACWSLAALFNLMPNVRFYTPILIKSLWENKYYCYYKGIGNYNGVYTTSFYDESIDACVEMILKLDELNLL